MLEYIKSFAQNLSLEWEQDAMGNLCVRRPGSAGGENAPTVVIQGHVDMVCEKEMSHAHDFSKDSIKLEIKDDWLTAVGTTLGADNGLGVAAGLALLEMPSDVTLPPIEGLFTVQEEIGLVGAKALDGGIVKGRILLNLDAEDWPNIYVGCAGGGQTKISLSCGQEDLDGQSYSPALLTVAGLTGGHSGADIHKYLASAIKVMGRVLDQLVEGECCRVIQVNAGGQQHNVIPRECEARVLVKRGEMDALNQRIEAVKKEFALEYGVCEKSLQIELEVSETNGAALAGQSALTREDQEKVLALINLLPHGPIKFSHNIPGLVETSNNIASIRMSPSSSEAGGAMECVLMCSTRSSVNGAIETVRRQFRALAGLCGATITGNKPYPGWQPNLDSRILKCTLEEVTNQIGYKPKVTAIHAGLECGIIGEKLDNCDMVAFGPTILGAHTPQERVQISTVEPFWNLVLSVVQTVVKNY